MTPAPRNSPQPARIVVFADDLSQGACRTVIELERRLGAVDWLIVSKARLPPRADQDLAALPGADYRAERLLAKRNLALVDAAEGAAVAAEVERFAPDLGLVLAAAVPGAGLIERPRLGTIALHKGRLPHYRGAAPVFWALWNGDEELICSIARLATGQAAIGVIGECTVRRPRYATLEGMELLLEEAGIRLIGDTIEHMLAGTAPMRQVDTAAADNPAPTPRQRDALRRRLGKALPAEGPFARRAAKAAYYAGRYCLGRIALPLRRHPLVTVLTYHRVNDEQRDNVTVGIEQFDRQMALLRRHCQVVSIEDVVAGALPDRPSRPLVAVTFDDGYADNFMNAMPILLKHQVPAAFFVSTGFIGTERRFPHDVEKGLTDLPNMGWDDLRTMRRNGQVIGSHTVSHIDCAKAEGAVLRRELDDSLSALKRELGIDSALFAYPFGRPANMTPAALARVKESGYRACLSSYGGVNPVPVDRFDVRRGGVNWKFPDLVFLCRAWGLT